MKKILGMMLMLATMQVSAQLQKTEVERSYKTNVVEKGGELLASAELYKDYVEIIFLEKGIDVYFFFAFTNQEFKEVGDLLKGYSAKDHDYYTIAMMHGGSMVIKFDEKNGYVQSIVLVNLGKVDYEFPKMNRVQYGRLFKD